MSGSLLHFGLNVIMMYSMYMYIRKLLRARMDVCFCLCTHVRTPLMVINLRIGRKATCRNQWYVNQNVVEGFCTIRESIRYDAGKLAFFVTR